jgi:hypothetical protein
MPLGETLTLLTTLATALQAFRLNRATETAVEEVESAPTLDPSLLIALDAVKSANDETVRRYDAAANGAHLLIGLSAATVLVSGFLGAATDSDADGGSPLFIASLVIFIVIAVAAVVLRRICTLRSFPADAVAFTGTSEAVVETILKARQQVHRANERRFALLQIGSDFLLLVVAVQVVLAALWLII